ncbi:MAG: sigma-70 family RNA polymerase sigma factor [Acidobacteria bacterium]|nr:sigma-70 family RNA polymerase sigma factor [Acidobacteriota bacterium]
MTENRANLTMNEQDFTELYQRTAGQLRSFLLGMGVGAALADDLLQETFVRFLTASPPPMDEQQRKSYLFRIAHNLAINHFRARRREERHLSFRTEENQNPPDRTLRLDMQRLFAHLPARERALLWLCHVEHYSHAEVAAMVGVNSASVRVLLFRIRQKFARMIRQSGIMEERT